jgi:hypothetical protein
MTGGGADDEEPMLVMGEVHTGLLQHSAALSTAACEHLLTLRRGERIQSVQRPIAHVSSPSVLTGIDCQLAPSYGAAPRAVGSVAVRRMITGGHILQSSAVGELIRSSAGRRLPWGHYLAHPGRIELIGKADAMALAMGFLAERHPSSTLDLTAVSARSMDAVQAAQALDRVPPFRTARTRLRWTAIVTAEPDGAVRFTLDNGRSRTVLVACHRDQLSGLAEFCADLALHDWLLTTLLTLVERSRIGAQARSAVVRRLAPAFDHLLHLWMPDARTNPATTVLWEGLERRSGLSRQWHATVSRIRDQLALSTISLLAAERPEGAA